MESTRPNSKKTSRFPGLLLAFVALGFLITGLPGFAYFYWVRDTGLGMSIVLGVLIGSFVCMTIEHLFGACAFAGEAIGKRHRR
jgi:hypothetical protein